MGWILGVILKMLGCKGMLRTSTQAFLTDEEKSLEQNPGSIK